VERLLSLPQILHRQLRHNVGIAITVNEMAEIVEIVIDHLNRKMPHRTMTGVIDTNHCRGEDSVGQMPCHWVGNGKAVIGIAPAETRQTIGR